MLIMGWDDFGESVERDSYKAMQGPRCKTCAMLKFLPEEGSEELQKALDAPMVTSTSIRRALLSRVEPHHVPSAYSISRHRRGECRKV
jgi:hypothetical protein